MLKIVTPVSRVENLLTIQESFKFNGTFRNDISWVLVIDESVKSQFIDFIQNNHIEAQIIFSGIQNAFVGHAHRNYFIERFASSNDWIWFLDDDTTLCDNYHQILELIKKYESKNIFCVLINQVNGNLTPRLQASWDNIRVGSIDMGQYIFKVGAIPKGLRFDETKYEADGIFIEALKNHYNNVLDRAKWNFLILPAQEPEYDIYSIYNSLR